MNNEDIKTNKIFTIFFALFFTLYQYPIIQVLLFVLLGLYVSYDLYFKRKNKIRKSNLKNILFLLWWFGIFTVFVYLSKNWAIGEYLESRTIITLLRMLFVGIMIFLYCDTEKKSISIIKSYIIGVFIMCLVVVLFTPTSLYGIEDGDNYFGKIIKQHRNTIGSSAAECIIYTYFLARYYKFKLNKLFIIFFSFLIIISGSRGAIVELLVFLCIFMILNFKNRKTYRKFPIVIFAGILIYILILNIPYLYDKIFLRFTNMINTVTNSVAIDGSTYSRSLMKKVAIDIFEMHPILGAGIDGVTIYLSQFPVHYGYNFRAVYSHCNYTEIAANFGIVGLSIWYIPLFTLLKKMLKRICKDKIVKYLFSMFIAIIFTDNYKIPWTGDVSIISYFIIIIFFLNYYKKSKTV